MDGVADGGGCGGEGVLAPMEYEWGDGGRGGDEEAVTTPRRIRSFGVIIFLLLLLLCFIFCFGCFAARSLRGMNRTMLTMR